jgi:large subunit ribosomal protein L17
MKHQIKTKKLSRTKPHREAMLSNMAVSLFLHRTIRTTEVRAKELRRLTDRLIVTAKGGDLAARRQVHSVLRNETVVKKLFDEIAPHFKDRSSGFSRVLKIGRRKGDGAELSLVGLLTPKPKVETPKGKEKSQKKTAAKS